MMRDEYPDQEQRAAICYRQYRSKSREDVMETKVLGPLEIKDESKGEVEAIFATLDVVDLDEDVVKPGAILEGTKGSLSSYGHSAAFGDPPVGKGVFVTVDNKAIFRGRYFLSTERGREAFNTAKEMGSDQQWSFAFRVLKFEAPDEEWKAKGARRILTKLDAFEVSPVLRGAGIGTRTLAVKAAEPPVPIEDPGAAAEAAAAELKRRDEEAAETKRLADLRQARVAEAMEEYRRVQRSLKRMGLA